MSEVFFHNGKEYPRIRVGGGGDFYEDGDEKTYCTDCHAKFGECHRDGCDCERCPVCGCQLIMCDCELEIEV